MLKFEVIKVLSTNKRNFDVNNSNFSLNIYLLCIANSSFGNAKKKLRYLFALLSTWAIVLFWLQSELTTLDCTVRS